MKTKKGPDGVSSMKWVQYLQKAPASTVQASFFVFHNTVKSCGVLNSLFFFSFSSKVKISKRNWVMIITGRMWVWEVWGISAWGLSWFSLEWLEVTMWSDDQKVYQKFRVEASVQAQGNSILQGWI